MRLLSMRVRNFKGVPEAAVAFVPTGITLIQGPNEIGKTSLMSAFDLLVEYQDSSHAAKVLATKPWGQDLGTEVEARFQMGSETYTYAKRFHRDRETRLAITGKAAPRQLAGREAHEAVRDLIATKMDWELWSALKIVQGQDTTDAAGVALGRSASLRDALDRAAGGGVGSTDDSLFDRVEAEWRRYFTNGGREQRAVFQAPRQAVADHTARVDLLTAQIREVLADAERVEFLGRRLDDLTRELGRARGELETLERAEAEIAALEARQRDLLTQQAEEQVRLAELERAWTERQRFYAEEVELLAAQGTREQRRHQLEDELASAQRALTGVQAAWAKAEADRRQAQQLWDEREEDRAMVAALAEQAALDRKLAHIRDLTQSLAQLVEARDRIRVTAEDLQELRRQVRKVHSAQSALEVGSPTATLRALGEATVLVDGQPTALAARAEYVLKVAEPAVVEVPGLLQISIVPGASVSELQVKREQEEGALAVALARLGAASPTDAEDQWNLRTRLEAQAESVQQQLDAELAGTDMGRLEQSRVTLAARVADYRARRPRDYALPLSDRDAREAADQARAALTAAEEAFRTAVADLAAAKSLNESASRDLTALTAEWKHDQDRLASLGERLAAARAAIADDALAAQVRARGEAVETLKGAVQAVGQQLAAQDPETTRLFASQKRSQVDGLVLRIQQDQEQRAELLGRLSSSGGLGLDEQLGEAEAALERAKQELTALEARAYAAQKLYSVMRACRDAAHERYQAPLRQQIVRLGRYVFGDDFDVTLDESLRVVARTRDGVNLPVEALSTGAQEQLALLTRLAAASLVDPDEGVPIILDDTLGHTDDDRLDHMAAVLNLVAERCQIILLASSASRYQRIGNAHVVELWPANSLTVPN